MQGKKSEARKTLKNDALDATIGVDTAVHEPLEIWKTRKIIDHFGVNRKVCGRFSIRRRGVEVSACVPAFFNYPRRSLLKSASGSFARPHVHLKKEKREKILEHLENLQVPRPAPGRCPGCAASPSHTSFFLRLVLCCIEADFDDRGRIFQLFSRSTKWCTWFS